MNSVPQVLLLAGDDQASAVYRDVLHDCALNADISVSTDGDDALARLHAGAPAMDVVLVDLEVVDGGRHGWLERLRSAADDAALVFLAEVGQEAQLAAAIEIAADDFLVKDAGGRYLQLLAATVQRAHRQRQAQRQMRETLRTSEERLSLVVRATNEAIWDCDLVRGTVWWDEVYDAEFGPRPPETKDSWKWWLDRIHADDRQRVLESATAALEGRGELWKCEYRYRRTDGSYADVLDRASIARDEAGKPTRFVGAMLDITQSKRQQEQLLLRDSAFASISNGILITDPNRPDNPIIYCNAAFERITGYRQDEILGRNCRFLQGDDRDQQARHVLREAITAGQGCTQVLRNYTKEGALFWNELTVSPVHDADGRLAYFMGIVNDITARVLARRAQRESDRRLAKIADALPILISYVDAHGQYQYNNAAYEEWFGHPVASIKGRNVAEVLGAEAFTRVQPYVNIAMAGREVSFATEIPHAAKGVRRVDVTMIPQFGDNSNVLGFHVMAVDTTERQMVEEQQARQVDLEKRYLRLTESERDVLRLLLQGLPNKVVALKLDIGLRTAERRRHDILSKMNVDSVTELAAMFSGFLEAGLGELVGGQPRAEAER